LNSRGRAILISYFLLLLGVIYFASLPPQPLQAVFYGAAGRLNPAWRPCNIGKLGQGNEDYYHYYYYQEAVSDPVYGPRWKEAIKLELRTLIQFGTWRYVRRPKDQVVVSTKWVFDVKYSGMDGLSGSRHA
jgi:hypothetical protein